MNLLHLTSSSHILSREHRSLLFSYGNPVAVTVWDNPEDVKKGYKVSRISTTTSRHINQFLRGISPVEEVTEFELLELFDTGMLRRFNW